SVFGNYYYISVLGFSSLSILAGLPGFVSGFLMYMFIPKLKKFGNNRQIFIANQVLRAVIISLAFFIGMNYYTNAYIIIPIMAIQSFFISASDSVDMVIPTEMLGDTVDYMEWKTGNRSEGMTFSVLTFVGKFTSSISTAIGVAILPLIGFVVQNGVVVKAGNTDFWLWAFFTIIPAVFGLLQIIPYFFYDLVGDKKKKIEEEMKIRREQISKEVSAVKEEN
ncbi:MAG: MFS transporter, partial [Clostridia bacterium]